jgi:hypothetical protein
LFDYFDKVKDGFNKDCKQTVQVETDSQKKGENEGPLNIRATARIFMEGMTGDDEILPYRDQVEVVAGFAEQKKTANYEKHVALLDDMSSGGADSGESKVCRSYRWTLTLTELRARLSNQVVRVFFLILTFTRTNMQYSASR